MKFSFGKIPRHRKFHIEPIYFDQAKEERKERERRIREEMGVNAPPGDDEFSTPGSRVRGMMRRRMKGNFEMVRSERRKSNLRLILILIVLMFLFYYFIFAGARWHALLH